MRKNTIRRRAQTAAPNPTQCEACGVGGHLERHHPNYSEPDRFEVLCPPCHVKADQRDGTRKMRQAKACTLCGAAFMPTHSKKHSLCSAKCRSEMGRINAEKRWGPSGSRSPRSLASRPA